MSAMRSSGAAMLAALGLAFGVAACSPSALPSVSAEPLASGSPSESPACPSIPLIAPDGSQVRLTGTWSGFQSGIWIVNQSGGCVTIEGYSSPTEELALGEDWRAAFSGSLASDFIIAGRFTWTYATAAPPLPAGQTVSLTLRVDFAASGDPLIEIDPRDLGFDRASPPFTETLVRISPSTALPEQ